MSKSENTDTGIDTVKGEVTIYTAAEIQQRWLDMVDQHRHLELDLAAVTELDCAGVQLLLALKKQLLNRDGSLSLRNHSDAVIELFELLALSDYFTDPLLLSAHKGG